MNCRTRPSETSYLTPWCLSHPGSLPISPEIRVRVLKPPEVRTCPQSVQVEHIDRWACLHTQYDAQITLHMYYLTTLYSRFAILTLILGVTRTSLFVKEWVLGEGVLGAVGAPGGPPPFRIGSKGPFPPLCSAPGCLREPTGRFEPGPGPTLS
jgi:hypothetical protein